MIVENKGVLLTIGPRYRQSAFQSYEVRAHGKFAAAGYFNAEQNLDEVIAAIMAKHHAELDTKRAA
jgi:hypothetical protein